MNHNHLSSFTRSFCGTKKAANQDSWASDLSEEYEEDISNYCYDSQGRHLEPHQPKEGAQSVDSMGLTLLDDEPSIAELQSFMSIPQDHQHKENDFQSYKNDYSCTHNYGNKCNYGNNNYPSKLHTSNASLFQQQSNPKTVAIVSPHEDSNDDVRNHVHGSALSMTNPILRFRSSGEISAASFLSPRTMSIYEKCFAAMEQNQQQQQQEGHHEESRMQEKISARSSAAARPAPCLPARLPFSDNDIYENSFAGSWDNLKHNAEDKEQEAMVEIEISPNEFRVLRGTVETLKAIQQGRCQIVQCLACDARLQCINDCEMVVCPDCRTISPILIFENDDKAYDSFTLPGFCREESDVKIGKVENAFDDNQYGDDGYGRDYPSDFGSRKSHPMTTASFKQQQDLHAPYASMPGPLTLSTASSSQCSTRNSACNNVRPRTVALVRHGVGLGVRL